MKTENRLNSFSRPNDLHTLIAIRVLICVYVKCDSICELKSRAVRTRVSILKHQQNIQTRKVKKLFIEQ